MITLDQAIQDIIELNRQDNIAFSKRQDKLRLMWSEANDNLSPNIDCNGRFHAPCSGYCLPTNEDYSTTLNKGEEFYFEKGQYLPIPITDSNYSKILHPKSVYSRVKTTTLAAQHFVDQVKDMLYINTRFNIGKSWEYLDQDCCYLYTIIESNLDRKVSEIVNEYLEQYMPTHREYTRKFTGVMVEGKRTVRGTVKNIGCSVFHGNRFKSVTQKITVELDDNTTCYGSVPSNVNVAIGDRVEFTATFSKSDTIHHGWYKRPSKFTIGVRNAY